MKYFILIVLLFSCNALEVIEGIESRVESNRDEENIPYMDAYWMEGNLSNSVSLNASWSSLTTAGATTIDITVYDQANCVGSEEDSMTGQPVTLTSHTFNPSSEGYYSFSLELFDDLGISMGSFCSDQIEWDETSPLNPLNIGWGTSTTPGSDSNQPSQTIAWDASASGDTASYTVRLFSDMSCTSPFGTDTLVDVSITNLPVNGLPPGDYTFTVTTTDFAGNSSISGCSSSMSVDTTPPFNPSSLAWTETNGTAISFGSTITAPAIRANWVSGGEPDLEFVDVHLYESATANDLCTGSLVSSNTNLIASNTYTEFSALTGGKFYSFEVTIRDFAGNISQSICSPGDVKIN